MTDVLQIDTDRARDLSRVLAAWSGQVDTILATVTEAETLADIATNSHGPLSAIATDGRSMSSAITTALGQAEAFRIALPPFAFIGFQTPDQSADSAPATDDELADLKRQLDNFDGDNPFEYDVRWEQYRDAVLSRATSGHDVAGLVGVVDPTELAIFLQSEHGNNVPSDIALAYLLHDDSFLDQAAGKGGDDNKYGRQDLNAVDRADVSSFEWALVTALRDAPTLLQEVAAVDDPQRFVPAGEDWAFTDDHIETFLEFQSALTVLAQPGNADWIDSIKEGEGIDGYIGDKDLDRILNADIPDNLRAAVEFLHDHEDLVTRMAVLPHITTLLNRDGEEIDFGDDHDDLTDVDDDLVDDGETLWDEHQRDGFNVQALQATIVRTQAFASQPEAARIFVEGLPVVENDGEHHFPVGLFDQEGVRLLANLTLPLADDRVQAHRLIAGLPETYQGTRNELINGFYNLLAEGVEDWVGGPNAGAPDRAGHPGFSWIQVAPWASLGLRPALTEGIDIPNFFDAELDAGQLAGAADGNQWIFNDVGYPYAALLDLLDEHPEPNAQQWQDFFADNFDEGDGTLRNGFVALVGAVNETDPVRAQELMYQSNILLATHEQLGVQPYLVDVGTLIHPSVDPNGFLSGFIQLDIGDVNVAVTDPVPFPDVGPDNHLFWGTDPLTLDPGQLEPGDFSTDTFTFVVGDSDGAENDQGTIVLDPLTGVETRFPGLNSTINDWVHNNQGTRPIPSGMPGTQFFGTDAGDWNNVDERMWFLATLFYVTQFEPSLANTPLDVQIENVAWLDPAAVPTFDE